MSCLTAPAEQSLFCLLQTTSLALPQQKRKLRRVCVPRPIAPPTLIIGDRITQSRTSAATTLTHDRYITRSLPEFVSPTRLFLTYRQSSRCPPPTPTRPRKSSARASDLFLTTRRRRPSSTQHTTRSSQRRYVQSLAKMRSSGVGDVVGNVTNPRATDKKVDQTYQISRVTSARCHPHTACWPIPGQASRSSQTT